MHPRFTLWFFLAATLLTAGCRQFEVEVGFKQPAELTATAEAQSARPTATPKPQLGKLAFVRGGDIWVKELPDGEEIRLTQDGRNDEPRWSASGQWLAFRKDYQVWVVRSDGSNAHPVHFGRVGPFVWSPNADRLAYIYGGGLEFEQADGSWVKEAVPPLPGPVSASEGKGVTAIAWSPDGQWVAFEQLGYDKPSSQGLWRAKADGSAVSAVYLNPNPQLTQSHLAGWTPDGGSLVYWQGKHMSSSLLADGVPLMQVAVAGGAPVTVTQQAVLYHRDFLDWSPDGKQLALVIGDNRATWENKAIAVVPSKGELRLQSESGRADLFPSWSPDGRRIAFSSGPASPGNRGGENARGPLNQRRIWIEESNGSAKRQLTNDSEFRDERPQWSEDGSYILFTRYRGEQAQIWLMRADGAENRRVVDELTPSPNWFGNFGYVDWGRYYDWWSGPGRSSPPTVAILPATPPAAPTAVSTPLPAVAPPPVLIKEGNVATEPGGLYIADTGTGRLWSAKLSGWSWSPDGKTLAASGGGLDLLNLETGSAVRIVDGMVEDPAWSPDGKQLAFYRPEERFSGLADSVGLYTVNRDGSGLRRHSLLPRTHAISWSPDGRYLSFSVSGEGNFLLDLRTGEIGEVVQSRSMRSAWLEDGRSLLLGDETGLYLYNLETKDRRQISTERAASFALSPDGTMVIISSGTGYYRPNARLLVVNLPDGSAVKPPLEIEVASWSPDGKQIAYLNNGCQGKGGDWDVFITPADGDSTRRLTDSPGNFKEGVSWSPAGTSIAFAMGGKVMLVDANTGELRTLASDESEYFHMHGSTWSPDGRYVMFWTGGHGYCD